MSTEVRWLNANQQCLVLRYEGTWSMSTHEAAFRQVQRLIRSASMPLSLIIDARGVQGHVPKSIRADWSRVVPNRALCMIVPNDTMKQEAHEIFLPSMDDATEFLKMFFFA